MLNCMGPVFHSLMHFCFTCFILHVIKWSLIDCSTKVYRIWIQNFDEYQVLENLQINSTYQVDIWQHARQIGDFADIMIFEKDQFDFERWLKYHRMNFSIAISNVEKLIMEKEGYYSFGSRRASDFISDGQTKSRSVFNIFDFSEYLDHDQITASMKMLQTAYPHLAQTEVIGYTVENRPIMMLQITDQRHASADEKPGLWIDAGTHAREWLSITTALYIISTLIQGHENDDEITDILRKMCFYIVPVVNPDGYEYSRSDKTARVDLNRNYDFAWGKSGTGRDPCQNIYGGFSAFSELETQAVRNFVMKKRSDDKSNSIKGWISLHTYAQMWFYPFGNKRRTYPTDVSDMKRVAEEAIRAIKNVYGTQYRIGTGADLLYEASGASYDWAKGKAKVKYSYLLELRPQNNAHNGFIVDKSQIIPTGKETWAGIKVVARTIAKEK